MSDRGSFSKASVRDAPVDGARVLLRADLNVPLSDDPEGPVVADDTRIRAALPTIELLRERGAAIVLVSHLDRPKEGFDPALSTAPVAARLAELLGAEVERGSAVVGPEVEAEAARLGAGDVLMLENSRFEPGEERNDPELAAGLAGSRRCSSTTRSAPPIALTRARSGSPGCFPGTRVCCSIARSAN